MKDDDLYFLQLTIYQYDKNKIKMDYSIIPVTFQKMSEYGIPKVLKSGVSDETIDIDNMLFDYDFVDRDFDTIKIGSTMFCGEIHDKKKEGKVIRTSILVYSPKGLEEEETLKRWLKTIFKRRWFYKIKYLKFLKKKESLNQF